MRDFAADATKRVHRFKPMPAASRAFLHSLAEDFGLFSESEDPGVNRAVTVLKTQGFVSAPFKSLSAALRLRSVAREKEAEAKAATEREAVSRNADAEHFNAFVISAPAFGLTIEDLEAALKNDLQHPSVAFNIHFRPSGEVILKAASRTFADVLHPANVHETLKALKAGVTGTVTKGELAGNVHLANVDEENNVVRREKVTEGGWNEVVRRGRQGVSPGREPQRSDSEAKKGKLTLKLGAGTSSARRGRDRERINWIGKMREGIPDME